MDETLKVQEYFGWAVRKALKDTSDAIEDLSQDELHFRPGENCNSIGFDAWHVVRTADNLVHFAFERELPIWLQQGLNEAWDLPKANQGTDMDPDEAYALRFPEPSDLVRYFNDVADAIVPKIEQMTDEYLLTTTVIRPQGELTKHHIIGEQIIRHCNNHIGMLAMSRTLLGKRGIGI